MNMREFLPPSQPRAEKLGSLSPEILQMYEISGHDTITNHSFDRYLRDKEQDASIQRRIEDPYAFSKIAKGNASREDGVASIKKGLESTDPEVQIEAVEMIPLTPEEGRAELIEQGLGCSNPEVRKAAASMIQYASRDKISSLIKKGLEDIDSGVRMETAWKIMRAPKKDWGPLVKQGFGDIDPKVQKVAAEMLRYFHKGDLPYFVKYCLENTNSLKAQEVVVGWISEFPEEERGQLETLVLKNIERGLADTDPEVQKDALKMVSAAPEEKRVSLIRQGLENPNSNVREAAVDMIEFAPKKERGHLIKECLASVNPRVQLMAAYMIKHAPKEEYIPLVQQGLESDSAEVQESVLNIIQLVPHEERAELIRQGLSKPDPVVQAKAISMVQYAPESARASLINECFEDSHLVAQRVAARMIRIAPNEDVLGLIEQSFENVDPEIRKTSMEQTQFVYEVAQISLLRKGLKDPNPEVQKRAVEMIAHVRDPLERASLVEESLGIYNPEIQKAAIGMIKNVPEMVRGSLEKMLSEKIMREIEDASPDVQKIAGMFKYIPGGEREKLFSLIVQKGLGKELIETPLYRGKEISGETFSRHDFEKTGSATTLIGGKLKERTIVRTIEPDAFLAWQRLYEDYALWKNAGFDYVPIEPIQSYKLNKNGQIDVYSGVLDLNLYTWENTTSMFHYELDAQKEKILLVLEKLGVEHGHAHTGNFCLRFFRDDDGQPNFRRAPRLYLIDFDRAVSPEKGH